MLTGVVIAILVSLGMVLIRAIMGPSYFDRVIAVNSFGTNIVVLIVLVGYILGTEFFIDIAITYALINFISTIAILRYFKYRERQ